MHNFLFDVRFAFRMFRASPGVFAVAILTLALSIGANTAIFSFVNAVLLKALPYPHPEEIMRVLEKPPGGDYNGISTLNFLDWKNQNTVFTAMAAQTGGATTLLTEGEPVQVRGSRVSAPYFDIFGIKAALGRTFAPDEDQLGKQQVVVLSHRFWQSQFGADRSIIGRTIRLDGKPYTVIGVLPGASAIDQRWEDVWTPLAFEPKDMTRDFHWMGSYARLKPGVTVEQARAQMRLIGKRIEKDHPDSNKGWSVAVDRYADKVVDDKLRQSLYVLIAAVGGILLIGCANLANLLLARGASREREVAIRGALGAGRWRVIRQFLTESVLLAAFGGTAGLLVGFGAMWALKTALPPFYLPSEASVSIDWRVLIFTAAIVLFAGTLFGMAPAIHASRADITASMREGGRGATTGVSRGRLRNALVMAEVALAFILLASAGLMIRSFYQLQQVDPGFDSTNVLTMYLPMPVEQYSTDAQVSSYFRQVIDRVDSVPGVRDAATTSALPLQGWGWGMPFLIQGDPVVDVANRPGCFWKMVSPSYFRTLGMRLVKGRGLAETDTKGSTPVTVINESMRKKYFKERDPIGRSILIQQIITGRHELGPEIPWQVIGVVADEKVNNLEGSSPGVYVSYAQSPYPGANLIVRGALDPSQLTKSVQRAIWSLNKSQAVTEIKTLEQIKSESVGGNRLRTVLLLVFASLALLLAAIGIYGVTSYSVLQRTHEMGVRAALGASRWDLLRLVLGRGAAMTGVGLLVGIAGAIGLTRLIASLLFGVSPYDPGTLFMVAIVLAAVALCATYVPARRATRVQPMAALRYE
jgi:putative ABC transport system permease protein